MSRTNTHLIESQAINFVRTVITDFYEDGKALYREMSERDYGIDGVVEIFDDTQPTGKIAFIQVKGTKCFTALKNKPVISCQISNSNAQYAIQKVIPVFLIYVSLEKPEALYFVNLQTALADRWENSKSQKSISVHIPLANNTDNLKQFFAEIDAYYE